MSTTSDPEILTCDDAAEALGMTVAQLSQACVRRSIRFVPLPGKASRNSATVFSVRTHGIPRHAVDGLLRSRSEAV
jgi:hypothetical protein